MRRYNRWPTEVTSRSFKASWSKWTRTSPAISLSTRHHHQHPIKEPRPAHGANQGQQCSQRGRVPSNCSRYWGSCMLWESQFWTSPTVHSVTKPLGMFAGIGEACCQSPITVIRCYVLGPTLLGESAPVLTKCLSGECPRSAALVRAGKCSVARGGGRLHGAAVSFGRFRW